MKEIAKVHRDGKGVTFVDAKGYSAYRLLRTITNGRTKNRPFAVVKQRRQQSSSPLEVWMPLGMWKALLNDARGREGAAR